MSDVPLGTQLSHSFISVAGHVEGKGRDGEGLVTPVLVCDLVEHQRISLLRQICLLPLHLPAPLSPHRGIMFGLMNGEVVL